jgi:SET domain-containing protein
MKSDDLPLFEIRSSPIAGKGAFALQRIPARKRLIEYTGERVTHEVADKRYEEEEAKGNTHTVLFAVDDKIVIDAGVDGNDARFFNHSCEPNCTSRIVKKRVYLETLRTIMPGEELVYDYEIPNEGESKEEALRKYPCHCGSPNCRGTLLLPPAKPRRKAKRGARKKKKSRTPVTRRTKQRQRRSSRGERRSNRAHARTTR